MDKGSNTFRFRFKLVQIASLELIAVRGALQIKVSFH